MKAKPIGGSDRGAYSPHCTTCSGGGGGPRITLQLARVPVVAKQELASSSTTTNLSSFLRPVAKLVPGLDTKIASIPRTV